MAGRCPASLRLRLAFAVAILVPTALALGVLASAWLDGSRLPGQGVAPPTAPIVGDGAEKVAGQP